MERNADFVVGTNGHCFLCRDKIEIDIKSESDSILESIVKRNQSANQSIQYISRYLKMDMSKVFISDGAIPPHLLEKVNRSRLKVELCDDCSRLNETFSKLFRKLEKAEIKVASCLSKIVTKLANKKGTQKDNPFHELTKSYPKDTALLEKLKIAEALRHDAVQKCNHKRKLGKEGPRITVKKLTPEDIPQKRLRFGNHSLQLEQDRSFSIGSNVADDDFGHWHVSDNIEVDDARPGIFQSMSIATTTTSRQDSTDLWSQYTVDPDTRKLKCNVCYKQFAGSNGFYCHYMSVHLKVRFKCVICHADFLYKSSLIRHQQTVHCRKGVKSKSCSRTFLSVREKLNHVKDVCDSSASRPSASCEIFGAKEVTSNDTNCNFKQETDDDEEQANLQPIKLEPVELREPSNDLQQ